MLPILRFVSGYRFRSWGPGCVPLKDPLLCLLHCHGLGTDNIAAFPIQYQTQEEEEALDIKRLWAGDTLVRILRK